MSGNGGLETASVQIAETFETDPNILTLTTQVTHRFSIASLLNDANSCEFFPLHSLGNKEKLFDSAA
jgi:hypothetical protein